MNRTGDSLTIGQCATLACLLEATISKPGNVHRGADFQDTSFQDFAVAAVAVGPSMESAPQQAIGQTIYNCILATRNLISVNTNLGIVLLLAPLAKCRTLSRSSMEACLAAADATDCELIYDAIRIANPGGLGSSSQFDIANEPPDNLIDAMRAAADRDLIAKQYTNGFAEVFDFVVPGINDALARGWSLTDSVIHVHLNIMQAFPDSLIFRKNGSRIANQSAALAGRVLAAGNPRDESYLRELSDFDFWLRSDGNRRNPGTTADMITAGLFVGLRRGTILRSHLNHRTIATS